MTAGKQEKRKAYWEGKDGGRETIPFSLDNSTGFWLVWQNGNHPMTVWGGEVKLTTELGAELTLKKSKSLITLLCPITPDAAHLGPITNHAGVPSRVTETPFTTLIFHMRCVANRHDRGLDRDLLGQGREFPSTK